MKKRQLFLVAEGSSPLNMSFKNCLTNCQEVCLYFTPLCFFSTHMVIDCTFRQSQEHGEMLNCINPGVSVGGTAPQRQTLCPSPTEPEKTINPTVNCEVNYEKQRFSEHIAGWKQNTDLLIVQSRNLK